VKANRVVILDGYTDEPAGLGVPPYINTYPRLIAGVVWLKNKSAKVRYWTIDQARRDMSRFLEESKRADLVVIVAGCEVPGKYIGGVPIRSDELERIVILLRDTRKILVGPAARYGLASGGGSVAIEPYKFKNMFDEAVQGDIEVYLNELLDYGFEKARPWLMRENYDLANRAFIAGAKIVKEHPCFGGNLVVEIETYRGCPRWITGGCSFCIEPRYGKPVIRETEAIVKEIETLYQIGVRHVRLGKQPDILTYMARDISVEEFPKPNIQALESPL
jgi:radical SAM superfamily enzyme with C-terminal helix-hairpin-helix motif